MKHKIKILAVGLAVYCLSGEFQLLASQSELESINENIQELEDEQEQQETQVDALKDRQSLLYGELGELDQELGQIVGELTQLEQQWGKLNIQVETFRGEKTIVLSKQQEYYESMKKRIQFLYENGEQHFLTLLLESKNVSEAWEKNIYIEALFAYDREMLLEYRRINEDLHWKEDKLKQEQKKLEQLEQKLLHRRERIAELITEIQVGLVTAENKIGQAQEYSHNFESLIASQKQYEQQLEAELVREEAARQEEIRRIIERQQQIWADEQSRGMASAPYGGAASTLAVTYQPQGDDLDLLAAIIECEAGGESYEGKLAVGSVVLNRIKSSEFPNSLVEVLYQNKQFTPVGSGRFAVVLARGADEECYRAAKEVLAGRITLGHLFFRTNNGSKQGQVIGNHVFY
jgi:spore germination cell wall hydrolase CwlJ-like protein